MRNLRIFSYPELQQATSNFIDANRLREGLYRGSIQGTEVAVILYEKSYSENTFRQDVDRRTSLNNPQYFPVIGVCLERYAVVYEFMCTGTLEDRLACNEFLWQDRLRIATEISSVLVFLHSRKPKETFSGDVSPQTVLFDANGVSKLCSFVAVEFTGYIDPMFARTYDDGPSRDVYSFGTVILRLLTNKRPENNLISQVTEAWKHRSLTEELDKRAGWPCPVAKELCELALRCCDVSDQIPRPDAGKVFEKLKQIMKIKESIEAGGIRGDSITTFSYSELVQATSDFGDSNKLGEGGFGRVYRGDLRCTKVAVKMLSREGDANLEMAFQREVDILCRVTHLHLVQLIGVCPEKFALVYQFMDGGTLEDRLLRKDIPWEDRIRIAAEICSALVFLHSLDPEIVVHGDLKPANILMDASGTSKLGDFGICRIIPPSSTATTTHITATTLQGTDGYMDPVFRQSGKLQPGIDVYAFGMILLRLLTNKQVGFDLVVEVEDALEEKSLEGILDVTANWPTHLAEELAKVALSCCNYRPKLRPRLYEVSAKLDELKASSA